MVLFTNYINQRNTLVTLEINNSSEHYKRFILHLKRKVGFVIEI